MNVAKILLVLGMMLMCFGLIALFAQRIPWLYSWFGHLPGDIRYEGERTLVFVPLSSMVVVSVVLSIALQIVARLLR